MTTFANIWLALRNDANTAVRNYLTHDEADGPYDGPVKARAGRLFRFASDSATVTKLFKTPRVGAHGWHLWSISFSDPEYSLAQIKREFDWLLAEYPAQVMIVGAWKWNGQQFGATYGEDGNRLTEATYPIPMAQLLPFMPEVNGMPATEISDINLLAGQAPRDFS